MRFAVRVFEVDDQPEAGIRGAAENVARLRDDVLGFDRLAFEAGLLQGLLETGIGEVVVGLVAEAALGNDEGDRLGRGPRFSSPKDRGEDRYGRAECQ